MKTLLIDVDGTICNSAPGITESIRYACDQLGYLPPSPQQLSTVIGPPLDFSLSNWGIPDVPATIAAYRAHYDHIGWRNTTLFDGWEQAIPKWRKHALVATATSKGETITTTIMKHMGLEFDFVGAASDDRTRIEKKDVIAYTLNQLGASPASTLMIGDRIHDIEGAHTHNIPCVLVKWGYALEEEYSHADILCTNFSELDSYVTDFLRS